MNILRAAVSAVLFSMSDSEEDHYSDGEGGQDGANPKEWVRTVATHLNFIGGFNAFPGKRPGRMASSIVFDAVRTCNADRARQLLMVEGNVNAVNTSGSSLAHVAVRTGDWRMLALVLDFHGKVNVKESKEVGGGTPLHAAANMGNMRMVNDLLKVHADPSIVDVHGSTPLHTCARAGHSDIALALVQHARRHKIYGPNLEDLENMLDRGGKNAHYWAKEHGHEALCVSLAHTALPYNALEQFEKAIKDKDNRVWTQEKKKKKKGGGGAKKGGKGKKKK